MGMGEDSIAESRRPLSRGYDPVGAAVLVRPSVAEGEAEGIARREHARTLRPQTRVQLLPTADGHCRRPPAI